jgi:Carboxylesterase family
MFWLFGGGLQWGQASNLWYDGSILAAYQDVIVVAPNYRTNGRLSKTMLRIFDIDGSFQCSDSLIRPNYPWLLVMQASLTSGKL